MYRDYHNSYSRNNYYRDNFSEGRKVEKGGTEVSGKVYFGEFPFTSSIEASKEEAKSKFFDDVWKSFTEKFGDIPSFSLILHKYVPIIDAKITHKNGKQEEWFSLEKESIGGDSKKLFLDKFIETLGISKDFYEKIREFSDRIKRQIEDLEKQGYKKLFSESLKTSSRLIVGFGAEHVLETSITLHHLFGIPYIPASAIKGVVRMVSFWEIAENLKNDKEIEELQKYLYDEQIEEELNDVELKHKCLEHECLKHKLLFGTQGFKGLLVFLDAYPEVEAGKEIFELDIMNPHYTEYYTKGETPGDWESPKPIVFLTVKKDIPFHFTVLIDEYRIEEILNDKDFPKEAKEIIEKWKSDNYSELNETVKKWVGEALKEFGVGSKTRLGYGIFE
jgi:CRISPR-associated protein Cmr6